MKFWEVGQEANAALKTRAKSAQASDEESRRRSGLFPPRMVAELCEQLPLYVTDEITS